MCSTPAALALASWCVRKGTPAARTMGFGVCTVSGRNRVPLPPTRRIASVTCRLCFLPGPAELSFGRPVYADRRTAVSTVASPAGRNAARWSALSAALVTGRRGTGGAELVVELPPWAQGVEPVPVTGDHVQSYLRALFIEIATTGRQVCLRARIHTVQPELPRGERGDARHRDGRRIRGVEGAENRHAHGAAVEPQSVGAQDRVGHSPGTTLVDLA